MPTPVSYTHLDMIQKENPKILLLASPNNPTGNGLTPKELDELLAEVPSQTVVLIDCLLYTSKTSRKKQAL